MKGSKKLWGALLMVFGLMLAPSTVFAANHLHTTVNGKNYNSFSTSAHQNLFLPKETDLSNINITYDAKISATSVGSVSGSNQISGNFTGITDFTITESSGTKVSVRIRKSDLPTIHLSLNGTTLAKVNAGSKETKYPNNSLYVSDPENPDYALNETGTVEFKGRGNTSWSVAKKAYQIKFAEKTSVLGIKKAKKWTMIANHTDGSLMRNYLAYSMGRNMNMPGTPKCEYVDFWVDGEYIGNYLLCQKLDTNSSVLDLQSEYGVLFEMDYYFYKDADHYFSSGTKGIHFALKEYNGDTDAQAVTGMTQFKVKVDAFEKELYGNANWNVLTQYIDAESFVKYYWINEFAQTANCMHTSTYLYMDGPTDKVHFGPIWDYDGSMGNNNNGLKVTDMFMNSSQATCTWFKHLLLVPQFKELVKEEYQKEVSKNLRRMIAQSSEVQQKLQNSAYMNFIRWKILGGANPSGMMLPLASTYDENANRLRNWIQSRYNYLEGVYGAPAEITFTKTSEFLPRATLDETQLQFDLRVKGVDIPATNTAVRSQVTYTMKKIGGFDDSEKTPVVLIGANGYMKAAKSGVAEITASYSGVASTNSVVVIVPGDNNRDGKVSVKDITLMMKLIRGETKGEEYDKELCDMNGDGKVSAKDAMLLASMIRKRLAYTN